MLCFYVQSYFCFRLYVISKKLWVAVPMALLFTFAFLAIAVGVSTVLQKKRDDILSPYSRHILSARMTLNRSQIGVR
jgi:protein-S-isoprenylcysteine O-methyltransferase Ste14